MHIPIEIAADCLDALGNPTHLAIFRLLTRAGIEGRAVGRIRQEIKIPASTLTHHLKHLALVGLVRKSKAGTTHYCTANYRRMNDLILFLTENCCGEDRADSIHPASRINQS